MVSIFRFTSLLTLLHLGLLSNQFVRVYNYDNPYIREHHLAVLLSSFVQAFIGLHSVQLFALRAVVIFHIFNSFTQLL